MLYHQKSFAQVNFAFASRNVIPNLFASDNMIGLFPKLHFRQFSIVPAVADNAVLRRRPAGQIIRLRGASHRGKRRLNPAQRAPRPKGVDARRVGSEQRFGQIPRR